MRRARSLPETFKIFSHTYMATKNKMDRALNGPGPVEIVFSVVISLVLGILIGALHLVFKPVVVVKKVEEATEVGSVYFVEGSANSSKSRQWTRKRQMLAGEGPVDVVLTEDELNAWLASAGAGVKSGAAPAAEKASAPLVQPEGVNFRIQDGLMQVGAVGNLSALDFEFKLVVQTRGTFEPGANGFVFKPEEFYIGSLPAHVIPGLPAFLIKRLVASQELPADLRETWSKLTLVAVEGNALRLTLP